MWERLIWGENPVYLCLYIKIINLPPILSVVGKFSSFPYCTGTSEGDICSLLLFIGDEAGSISRTELQLMHSQLIRVQLNFVFHYLSTVLRKFRHKIN